MEGFSSTSGWLERLVRSLSRHSESDPIKFGSDILIQQSDELDRMAIWVTEVKLSRWHPANDGRLIRLRAQKILTRDAAAAQPLANTEQLRK